MYYQTHKDDICSICSKRRDQHENEDHEFYFWLTEPICKNCGHFKFEHISFDWGDGEDVGVVECNHVMPNSIPIGLCGCNNFEPKGETNEN